MSRKSTIQIILKNLFILYLLCTWVNGFGQARDTLKLSITKVGQTPKDTIFVFSSRVDTIALQPLKTDTSKIVKDENPQDLEESKYRIKLMGSVRVNSYFDFEGMPDTEGFVPYDIPIGEDAVDNLSSVYIGARQSRFGIQGDANTKVGSIKTYIEVDFASSSSSYFRLRHAFAEWGFFKLGYTWSTFMDNAALPTTVEFEGPNSALLKRHGIVRFERKIGTENIFGIGIEVPESDFYNPADTLIEGRRTQGIFDVASRYKWFTKKGHVQLAGVLRRIDFLKEGSMHVLYGWGIALSSAIYLNPKHSIFGQYSIGEGIAHYYVGFSGRELDAIYNPNTNSMLLKPIHGGYVNYRYNYNPKVIFSLTFGLSYVSTRAFEPSDAFKSSQYGAINGFYSPIETVNLGLELTTGRRTNKDNAHGNARRVSFIAQFSF